MKKRQLMTWIIVAIYFFLFVYTFYFLLYNSSSSTSMAGCISTFIKHIILLIMLIPLVSGACWISDFMRQPNKEASDWWRLWFAGCIFCLPFLLSFLFK